jgi:hypothetical protein
MQVILGILVVENRLPVNSILCIPSRNVPGFAVFFLYSPAPSPLPIILWVPSQGCAGNLIIAFPQCMAEPSKFSSPDIRLTSYSPHLHVSYFLRPPDL